MKKKYGNRSGIVGIVLEIIIGISLIGSSLVGLVDEFWSGMGTTLLVIGILRLIRLVKYKSNNEYRERIDTEINDERNKYLSSKAWAWAGYLFVMIAAIATIILKIVNKEELMIMASGSVCLIMTLYWVSFTVLKKKY